MARAHSTSLALIKLPALWFCIAGDALRTYTNDSSLKNNASQVALGARAVVVGTNGIKRPTEPMGRDQDTLEDQFKLLQQMSEKIPQGVSWDDRMMVAELKLTILLEKEGFFFEDQWKKAVVEVMKHFSLLPTDGDEPLRDQVNEIASIERYPNFTTRLLMFADSLEAEKPDEAKEIRDTWELVKQLKQEKENSAKS